MFNRKRLYCNKPCKQAVICWNGADTGSVLAHYGMFSRYHMWIVLTTKLQYATRLLTKALLEWHCATCILRYTAIDMPKPEHFIVWKLLYCDLNFIEVYPNVPIKDKSMLVQIMAQWPTGGKPWHQIDAKSSTTTKLKKSVKVRCYWHRLNHTLSTMSSENAATILVILNGVNWSRKLTKNYR